MEEEFAVRSSGWSGLPTSEAAWDEGQARAALNAWAADDMTKYGRAFLWSDGSDSKTGFKFPIAMPVNGKLTIFRNAVNNAKARLGSANIPGPDKDKMLSILNSIQGRYEEMSLVAAAAPLHPPKAWFTDPKLSGKTKIQVTPDGRVFGHLGTWDACHLTFANTCVTVPRSKRGYADFHVGTTKTAEGELVDTGVLTVDTGHADTTVSLVSAVKSHYDNTGTKAAIVRAGEDQYGVWIAGALAPGVDTEEMGQKLRQAPLSGDWRRIGGGLELVAALGVNRPGFAITAAGEILDEEDQIVFHVADDEVTCLIAASSFSDEPVEYDFQIIGEDNDPAVELAAEAMESTDCGCPDVKNRVKEYAPLPSKDLRARLATYEMI
jgi:hypothetical protein